jgi:hypothetical protein
MASEQSVVALAIFAASFLWYSSQLSNRGSFMWAQVFQILCFMFVLTDLTVLTQLFRADAFFDMEDLMMNGLFTVVMWLLWGIVLLWIFSLIFDMLTSWGKPKMEKTKRVGGNTYGPQ